MAQSVQGKVAIITGAAHGVGAAVARRFIEAGARVMLVDRDDEALASVVGELGAEAKMAGHSCCAMEDRLAVNNLIAATIDAHDRIDIVVDTDRVVTYGEALDMTGAEFAAAVDVNLRGPFLLAQAAAKRMIQQEAEEGAARGAIVFVSSVLGQRTVPGLLPYSVACAALDQLTRALAIGLAPHRIRVNGIAIGAVMTDALRDMLRDKPEMREPLLKTTPLGRIGDSDEAAEAALFLATGAASFVTGQVLAVDGGRSVLDPLATPAG